MMKLSWVWIVIAIAFLQLVTGFLDFNETELSLIEAYDYGVSKLNYSPLMVGLTLITNAGAKGAGTFPYNSFPSHSYFYSFFTFYFPVQIAGFRFFFF